jgi:hypothetical protein
MSHTCHATLCRSPCEPRKLMCLKHWKMVPYQTQLKVLEHYRRGQCDDMRPSKEWFNAANLAVAQVAEQENAPMSKHHRELLSQAGANA